MILCRKHLLHQLVRHRGQDFDATIGNSDGMLELGRPAAIDGHRGPIIGPQAVSPITLINHRFNGENHAWLEGHARMPTGVVRHLRVHVKLFAEYRGQQNHGPPKTSRPRHVSE